MKLCKNHLLLALCLVFPISTQAGGGSFINSIPANFKLAHVGISKCDDNFSIKGGQVLIFEVKNLNILGTTFSVNADDQGMPMTLLLPVKTVSYRIGGTFGCEPMGWRIKSSTISDVCFVELKIWSTWVEGMEPNC